MSNIKIVRVYSWELIMATSKNRILDIYHRLNLGFR